MLIIYYFILIVKDGSINVDEINNVSNVPNVEILKINT